jgi:NitT/TauT family transport system permease protein
MVDSTLPAAASGTADNAGRFSRVLVPRLIAGAVVLLTWEVVVRLLAPSYVAKPTTVLTAIPRVIVDPAFLTAAGSTLAAVAEGLAIALVGGTILGLTIGRSTLADRLLRHYVNAFYALPMVVVVPLFALWFGYTGAARLVTVVFAAAFSIIVNVADGARAVPREYLEVARSFRSARLRALLDVVLPASTPYFLAGLRLAAGRALIGAVVAEFITAIGGLGYFILYNSRTFHHNEAFVGVLLLAAFGVGFEALIGWSTRAFLPWYRRDERAE